MAIITFEEDVDLIDELYRSRGELKEFTESFKSIITPFDEDIVVTLSPEDWPKDEHGKDIQKKVYVLKSLFRDFDDADDKEHALGMLREYRRLFKNSLARIDGLILQVADDYQYKDIPI